MGEIHRQIVIISSQIVELAGIAAIFIGIIMAIAIFIRDYRSVDDPYHELRVNLGRGILVGLEFLVAADIIWTVGVEPTLTNVAVLAIIILLRTFLSMTLSMEVNNWLPWERGHKRVRK
ncbi:MAG: DUF1622 domain-containing protein [Pseudomonadota bacterium]